MKQIEKKRAAAILAAVALIATLALAACDNGSGGGTSNPNDRFAGKTFYNDSDVAKANTRYVFRTDGTYTEARRSYTGGDFEDPDVEYKYSLSADGKTFYRAAYRFNVSPGGSAPTMVSYQELVDYVNSETYKTLVKNNWDAMSPDIKKGMLSFYGLKDDATVDDFLKALMDPLVKISMVFTYNISTATDGASANVDYTLLSETVDSSSKDLSKMNFTGYFSTNSSVARISINSNIGYARSFGSAQISSKSYSITNIDSSKLYFEESSSSSAGTKETFEAAYTVEGFGNATKIKVMLPADKGGEIELTFRPGEMRLYEAK